jgi:hypothetical protein
MDRRHAEQVADPAHSAREVVRDQNDPEIARARGGDPGGIDVGQVVLAIAHERVIEVDDDSADAAGAQVVERDAAEALGEGVGTEH